MMDLEKAKKILFLVLSVFLGAMTLFGSVISWNYIGSFRPVTASILGTGKMIYKPDQAEVSLSVVSKGLNPESVQSDNDEKMSEIVNYLKDSGVKEEEIKTVSYNLYPEYEQGENYLNTFRIIGYTLEQGLSFKVKDISSVGKLVGGLSGKGVNRINGISFSLSDEKTEELKVQAKEKAVAKAKFELEKTKSLYGLKRARLISISDYQNYPSPIYRDAKAYGLGGEASSISPIQIGTGELEVNVSLLYELK
ncbi:MAG: hypothetical protein UW85_C0005G0030 [Parcubacteria group bacterium GW2011_GWA1_Parcubacteria_45_10]|nr:MAG: hypothetical protein UW85_C0005G0030 [Parcubacteria group bacterium GW2011_GWA1_Parcubacteria_45_10]KKT88487.1 MAG: hypothetical protein UW89_C0007G0030 [Parcubacteria group bacterium GW2011_GWB1_45_10]